MRRSKSLLMGFFLPALVAVWGFSAEPTEAVVQGHVYCVGEDLQETQCTDDSRHFAFRSDDGRRFVLSPDDEMTGMFRDPRVRSQRLRLRLWISESGRVDVVKVHSVRDGEIWDIYYFCSICNIRSHSGGPCWCCQQEFELVERPASEGQ